MPEIIRQFIRYTGVGGVSAIGHYGLLITLVEVFHVDSVGASVAGALLGAFINYVLNYRFTFGSTSKHGKTVARFGVIAASGLLLNTFLMWLAVEIGGMHYLVAQIGTTLAALIWNFIGNRCWTFQQTA